MALKLSLEGDFLFRKNGDLVFIMNGFLTIFFV